MALADVEIFGEIEAGDLVIAPFDFTAVGASSIDLRLSNIVRVYKDIPPQLKSVRLREGRAEETVLFVTERRELTDEGIELKPGELMIGYTAETITIPPHLVGWVEGRSGFARLGLSVHNTAPTIQPGWTGQIALELTNQGKLDIRLDAGILICQVVLERLGRPARSAYASGYQSQKA